MIFNSFYNLTLRYPLRPHPCPPYQRQLAPHRHLLAPDHKRSVYSPLVDCLDYAFEAGGGAAINVTNCKITNCLGVASTDGSTSAGILVSTYFGDGTKATIAGNTISNCATAIAVGYDAVGLGCPEPTAEV